MTAFDDSVTAAQNAKTAGDALSADNAALAQKNAALQAQYDAYVAAHPDTPIPPVPVVSTTQYGAYCGPDTYPSTESKTQMRARVTGLIGGMPVERLYDQGNWNTINLGHATIYSKNVDPGSVTNGSLDSTIDAFLRDTAATGHKMWFGLNHEADLNKYDGAPQVAAHKHVQARRDALGISKDKIAIGQITTSGTFYTNPTKIDSYQWSGQDFVGFDCYLRPKTVNTADKAFGPIIKYAATRGKPLVIGEMSLGITGHGGGFTETQWTTEVPKITAALSAAGCEAATWFYCIKQESTGGVADWRLTPHPNALASYKAAVATS